MFARGFALLSLLIALLAVYYNYDNRLVTSLIKKYFHGNKNQNLFTLEELQKYNGLDRKELYISILGNVFDVTRGDKYYGSGQAYNFFVGRDASRSFVTGDFTDEEGADEVSDFNHQELRSLNHWFKFYKKEYTRKGKLIGRFYDENGKITEYGRYVKALIAGAERADVNAELEKLKFPPCNVEWDAERGSRVWCSKRSGGIDRNWVGVPRQLYEPGSQSYRCACISEENKNLGNVKEYDGCDPLSESCYVKLES